MNFPGAFLEPDGLLEPPAGSRGVYVADGSDHLVTVPFEHRHRTVAGGYVWPTYIQAPQPSHPLVYQWSESTHMSSYALANHTMETNIPRPSAPSPNFALQDNLVENFLDVYDIPPLHPPPRHHRAIRFEPYHNDHLHKHQGSFLCRWDNEGSLCGDELQAVPKDIRGHLRQDHGIGIGNKETYRCLWITARGQCGEQLKSQSFGRHIIKHTGIKIKCSLCDTTMAARNDLATRHRHRHPNCSEADFIIVPGYNTD